MTAAVITFNTGRPNSPKIELHARQSFGRRVHSTCGHYTRKRYSNEKRQSIFRGLRAREAWSYQYRQSLWHVGPLLYG